MKIECDKVAWTLVALAVPLFTSGSSTTAEAAARIPGCHVKSLELFSGFPKHFGRLAKHSTHECVVISKPDSMSRKQYPESEGCRVWTGTEQEYLAHWECD